MAHQTSENQRKQTTPRIIGRLMDADFSRVSVIKNRSGNSGRAYSCRAVLTRRQRRCKVTSSTADCSDHAQARVWRPVIRRPSVFGRRLIRRVRVMPLPTRCTDGEDRRLEAQPEVCLLR
jgi:hypothetical protein